MFWKKVIPGKEEHAAKYYSSGKKCKQSLKTQETLKKRCAQSAGKLVLVVGKCIERYGRIMGLTVC